MRTFIHLKFSILSNSLRLSLLFSTLSMVLLSCSPVKFTPAVKENISLGLKCSDGSDPDSNGVCSLNTDLKITLQKENDSTGTKIESTRFQKISVSLSTQIPEVDKMILSETRNCGGEPIQFQSFVSSFELSPTQGSKEIYAKVISTKNEITSRCEKVQILFDNQAPQLTLNKIDHFGDRSIKTQVLINAEDQFSLISEAYCSEFADGKNSAPCLAQNALALKTTLQWNKELADGEYTLYVKVIDQLGNESQITPFQIKKHVNPPELKWVDPLASEISSLPFTAKFKYEDCLSCQVTEFECSVDSKAFESCDLAVAEGSQNVYNYQQDDIISKLKDGSHLIQVQAISSSGLKSNTLKYEFNLDRSIPSLKIAEIPAFLSLSNYTFSFSASYLDQPYLFTNYKCELFENSNLVATKSTTSTSCSFDSLKELPAQQFYKIKVTGSKTNKSASDEKSFLVDLTKPEVKWRNAPTSLTQNSTVSFDYIATAGPSGIASTQCQIDAGRSTQKSIDCPKSGIVNVTLLSEGEHTITIVTTNGLGDKSAQLTHQFIVDTKSPSDILVTSPSNLSSDPRPSFEFVAVNEAGKPDASVEANTGYQCGLNQSAALTSCQSVLSYPQNLASLTEGNHVFYVQATDKAGNLSAVKAFQFVIDLSGPQITFSQAAEDTTVGRSSTFNFTVNDQLSKIQEVNCFVDQSPFNCTLSGIGTNTVTGSALIPNLESHLNTKREIKIVAVNQVNLSSTQQLNWNVILGINPFDKLKPAVAVSRVTCLLCHANLKGDLISDFGRKTDSTVMARTWTNQDHSTTLNSNHVGEELFSSWGYRSNISSSIIEGTIYYQNSNFDNSSKSAIQSWVNKWTVANNLNNNFYPAKFKTVIPNISNLGQYLEQVTVRRTSDEMLSIKDGRHSNNLNAKIVLPDASIDANITQLKEVKNLKIGAPSVSDIRSLLASGQSLKYIADQPGVSTAESEVLSQIEKFDQFYRISGSFKCDGDLIVNGHLLIHGLNLQTRRGCRIYASGALFVQASSQRKNASSGIQYTDLSNENLYNIQLSSAVAVSMGLGKCKFGNSETWVKGLETQAARLAVKDSCYFEVRNRVHKALSDELLSISKLIKDKNGVMLLEDSNYDVNATQADYDYFGHPGDGTGIYHPSVQRQVHFERILINAPEIHSRYSGNIQGAVIANFMMPAVGEFIYKFDPVFQDAKVRTLPLLQMKNILFFEQ